MNIGKNVARARGSGNVLALLTFDACAQVVEFSFGSRVDPEEICVVHSIVKPLVGLGGYWDPRRTLRTFVAST